MKQSEQIKQYFESIIGKKNVSDHPDDLKNYGTDWSQSGSINPSLVLFPHTEEEISRIMSYCHNNSLAVVPSGGRTGLAAGACATNHEIILSLTKMNHIIKTDVLNMTIEAQAGTTTQQLQEAAAAENLFFPIDLGAKGSCQIGGNIATNAGGLRFIRFGGTREQVLGLRVVLSDGSILNLNKCLRKDNTGYDLKQIFIGSEGTLGIITQATLRLAPRPGNTILCLLSVRDLGGMLTLFARTRTEPLNLTAFEWMDHSSVALVMSKNPGLRFPLAEFAGHYALMEVETHSDDEEAALSSLADNFLAPLMEEGVVTDAVVAGSATQAKELWFFRESITECLVASGHVHKNDISIPLSSLGEFHERLNHIFKTDSQEIRMITFGHLGDGNLHLNYLGSPSMKKEDFHGRVSGLEEKVYRLTRDLSGSISAEHGIGLLKKNHLSYSRTPGETGLMKSIRNLLDPAGILNPGKLFD